MTTPRLVLPPYASRIAQAGEPQRKAVREFVKSIVNLGGLSLDQIDAKLEPIGVALKDWPAGEVPSVFRGLARLAEANGRLDIDQVPRWISEHRNLSDRLERTLTCADVLPPSGFAITDLRSATSAQKLVFGADWRDGQRAVVLKLPKGPDVDQIFDNEATVHRLSLEHPNIIETHVFSNAAGIRFLVEEMLEPLDDGWRARGVDDAANLLFDLASALAFLDEDQDLVHRDLKPDNLAIHGQDYVLLDFGICGKRTDVAHQRHPTGTTKTRAPEVLKGEPQSPASDVWALGATVFLGITGRFPLFERPDEEPPDLNDKPARKRFVAELCTRAETRFDELVLNPPGADGEAINRFEPLREVLQSALALTPDQRVSARELRETAERGLAPYIRRGPGSQVSGVDELRQLHSSFAPDPTSLMFMSPSREKQLTNILDRLQSYPGLSEDDRTTLSELRRRLGLDDEA